jgi:hypothetical protein
VDFKNGQLRGTQWKSLAQAMGINPMAKLEGNELAMIGGKVLSRFDDILSRYSEKKYPEDVYKIIRNVFSSRSEENGEIENALKWKWGHWDKENYPNHHKELIRIVQLSWKDFVWQKTKTPRATFDYWTNKLGKRHRYISVAFLTHLVHPQYVPIIDQHNYRAMNHYMLEVRSEWKVKKKPSTWEDIQSLADFLVSLSTHLKKDMREVDKYLMMFGKYYSQR